MPRKRIKNMAFTGAVLTVLGTIAGVAAFLSNLMPVADAAMREGWED